MPLFVVAKEFGVLKEVAMSLFNVILVMGDRLFDGALYSQCPTVGLALSAPQVELFFVCVSW